MFNPKFNKVTLFIVFALSHTLTIPEKKFEETNTQQPPKDVTMKHPEHNFTPKRSFVYTVLGFLTCSYISAPFNFILCKGINFASTHG